MAITPELDLNVSKETKRRKKIIKEKKANEKCEPNILVQLSI